MATIQENRKNGKLVSYKFTACVGRDAAGKQIRYYRTWTPPREYAPARARKYAQLEAAQWEQAIRKHGTKQRTSAWKRSRSPRRKDRLLRIYH